LACRHACTSQDHATWGECARSANLRIGDLGTGTTRNVDKRLNSYAQARSLGLQPPSTKTRDSLGVMRAAGA
jgi:hypothetical protein